MPDLNGYLQDIRQKVGDDKKVRTRDLLPAAAYLNEDDETISDLREKLKTFYLGTSDNIDNDDYLLWQFKKKNVLVTRQLLVDKWTDQLNKTSGARIGVDSLDGYETFVLYEIGNPDCPHILIDDKEFFLTPDTFRDWLVILSYHEGPEKYADFREMLTRLIKFVRQNSIKTASQWTSAWKRSCKQKIKLEGELNFPNANKIIEELKTSNEKITGPGNQRLVKVFLEQCGYRWFAKDKTVKMHLAWKDSGKMSRRDVVPAFRWLDNQCYIDTFLMALMSLCDKLKDEDLRTLRGSQDNIWATVIKCYDAYKKVAKAMSKNRAELLGSWKEDGEDEIWTRDHACDWIDTSSPSGYTCRQKRPTWSKIYGAYSDWQNDLEALKEGHPEIYNQTANNPFAFITNNWVDLTENKPTPIIARDLHDYDHDRVMEGAVAFCMREIKDHFVKKLCGQNCPFENDDGASNEDVLKRFQQLGGNDFEDIYKHVETYKKKEFSTPNPISPDALENPFGDSPPKFFSISRTIGKTYFMPTERTMIGDVWYKLFCVQYINVVERGNHSVAAFTMEKNGSNGAWYEYNSCGQGVCDQYTDIPGEIKCDYYKGDWDDEKRKKHDRYYFFNTPAATPINAYRFDIASKPEKDVEAVTLWYCKED